MEKYLHGTTASLAMGGSGRINVTFEFRRSLYWPLMTTRSPTARPDVIVVRPSVVGPDVIGRA
jgi:hypothetical protein